MKNALICMGEESEPGKETKRYDPTAANRALELLGKTDELGLFVERTENANTNFVISDAPLDQGQPEVQPGGVEDWVTRHRPLH